MKITVEYGSRSFGPSYRPSDYKLKIRHDPRPGWNSITLNAEYFRRIGGRGAGDKRGWISRAEISLDAEHARQLAVNILWALEHKNAVTLDLAFGKAAADA